MKKYDYLNGTDIYLYQDPRFLKINTDTILLGHFYKLNPNERILDIGTNNGALLLFKKGIEADFNAIELMSDALDIAVDNFSYNQMTVDCFCADIKQFNALPFDVIICNPPYFSDNNYNLNTALNTQRHDVHLNLNELFIAVNRLLKSNGRFYMVHRSFVINDIYYELVKHKMRIKTLQFVHDDHKQTASTMLIEIIKSELIETVVLNPHIIKR